MTLYFLWFLLWSDLLWNKVQIFRTLSVRIQLLFSLMTFLSLLYIAWLNLCYWPFDIDPLLLTLLLWSLILILDIGLWIFDPFILWFHGNLWSYCYSFELLYCDPFDNLLWPWHWTLMRLWVFLGRLWRETLVRLEYLFWDIITVGKFFS